MTKISAKQVDKNRVKLTPNAVSPAIIEDGKIRILDSYDLLTRSHDELGEAHGLNTGNLLQNNIGVGQRFLYAISQMKDCGPSCTNECTFVEIGTGLLTKTGRKLFLDRISASEIWDGSKERKTSTLHTFNPADGYLIVSAVTPQDYRKAYFEPYSVLASQWEPSPSPVILDESTVLGRLNGTIQSIDKDELRQILTDENVGLALESLLRVLALSTSFVDLQTPDSKLSAPVLHVKPYANGKRPPKPVRGSIIYDGETQTFMGFNGKDWRSLQWGGA